MSDDDTIALLKQLIDQVLVLTQFTVDQQAWIFALHAYLEAQPEPRFNIYLWTQLLEKYQTQGQEGYQRDAQKVLDECQRLLRDVKGRAH